MTEQVTICGTRELRWLQQEDCTVTYMEADHPFEDGVWEQWLEALTGGGSKKLGFIMAEGDIQPTKAQWRDATRLMRQANLAVAVVTNSRPTSALVKAGSWSGVEMQAFKSDQLIEAGEYLGMDRKMRDTLRTGLALLSERYGAPAATNPSPAFPLAPRPTSSSPSSAFASPSRLSPSRTPEPKPMRDPTAKPKIRTIRVSSASTSASASASTSTNASASSASSASTSGSTRPSPSPTRPSSTSAARPSTSSGASSSTPRRSTPRPSPTESPMAAAAAKNLEDVRRTSEEIQAKLAAIQARLRNRARINAPDAPTPPSKSNRGKDEKK